MSTATGDVVGVKKQRLAPTSGNETDKPGVLKRATVGTAIAAGALTITGALTNWFGLGGSQNNPDGAPVVDTPAPQTSTYDPTTNPTATPPPPENPVQTKPTPEPTPTTPEQQPTLPEGCIATWTPTPDQADRLTRVLHISGATMLGRCLGEDGKYYIYALDSTGNIVDGRPLNENAFSKQN